MNNNNLNSDSNKQSHEDIIHAKRKAKFRLLGKVLTPLGGLLVLISMIDFFSTFGSFGMPKLFFLMFLGLPMLGVGISFLRIGYLKEGATYVSKEITSPLSESISTIVKDSAESVRTTRYNAQICPSCQTELESNANFCSKCGYTIAISCRRCGEKCKSNEKFCKNCGTKIE